jgi:hypothetical protein
MAFDQAPLLLSEACIDHEDGLIVAEQSKRIQHCDYADKEPAIGHGVKSPCARQRGIRGYRRERLRYR